VGKKELELRYGWSLDVRACAFRFKIATMIVSKTHLKDKA
jgi:hypothetical protein